MEHSRSTLQTLQPSLNKADLVGIFHNAKYTRTMSNCIQELHSVTNLIYHASLNGLGWFCRPVLLWLCFDYAQNSTVLFPSVCITYHHFERGKIRWNLRTLSIPWIPWISWTDLEGCAADPSWPKMEKHSSTDIRHSAKWCKINDGEGMERHAMTWKNDWNVKEPIAGWSNWISGADSTEKATAAWALPCHSDQIWCNANANRA